MFQRKLVKVEGDADYHDLKLVSDFLKEANEEILLEIFVRLPNCRYSIELGSLCRYWHSLISHPQFIPRFILQQREHQDRYSLPFTIIFRKADKSFWQGIQCYQPICKLFSEQSFFIHGKRTCNYLDFLPSQVVIRASCNDLLLVSPNASYLVPDRYICNPITKQYYKLPAIRLYHQHTASVGHALICMPNDNRQYKVVELQILSIGDAHEGMRPIDTIMTWTFSSESEKWKSKCVPYPRGNLLPFVNFALDLVTCNGIVYWLEYERDVDRVIALDLLNSECGVIEFPIDFWWFKQEQQDSCDVRQQIGVVSGELRLLQVVLTCRGTVINFKVWKLNDKDSSWFLVHHRKTRPPPSSNDEEQLVFPFVHPTDGDVIFTVWGRSVFRYNLVMKEVTYEMVDELEESLKTKVGNHWRYNDRLISFPMVHPPWPTLLPATAAI